MSFKIKTALLLLCLASAVILFRDFFLPGLPTGFDLGTHFFLAQETYGLLVETGFWDGLLPQWYLGFSPFVYYPDLFYLIFAACKFVLSSALSDVTLYKLLLVGVFYLPILGGFYLTYLLSKSALFALLAAVLITSVSVFAGAGFEGHFLVGLINQTLGIGLYLFCIAFFLQWQKTADIRHNLLSLSFFILITQAHMITIAIAALTLVVLVSWDLRRKVHEKRFGECLFQLKIVAMTWFIPLAICLGGLAYRVATYWDEHGTRSGWGDVSLFEKVYSGELFSTGLVNMVVAAVITVAFFYKRFREQWSSIGIVFILLLVLGAGYVHFDGRMDIFNSVFKHRAWGFAGVLGMVLGSGALYQLWECAESLKHKRKIAMRAVLIAISGTLIYGASGKIMSGKQLARPASTSQSQQALPYSRMLERIKHETPADSVVLYQLNGEKPHASPFLYLAASMAIYSGRTLVQGQQAESAKFNVDEDVLALNQAAPEKACAIFRRLSATHFLAWSDPVLSKMSSNPCFSEVITEGHFHLFAYKHADFMRLTGENQVTTYLHSRHRYSWVIHWDRDENRLVLGIPFHPRFMASVNGTEVHIERTFDNLIAVHVPDGESILTLEYRIPPIEKLLGFIEKTVAGLAMIIILWNCFFFRIGERVVARRI